MQTINIEHSAIEQPVSVEPHAIEHGVLENNVKPKGSIAASATMLTPSGLSEENFDIFLMVANVAKIKLGPKSSVLNTGKINLNRTKLISSAIKHYRATFASVYLSGETNGRGEEIPTAKYVAICEAVDKLLFSAHDTWAGQTVTWVNMAGRTKILSSKGLVRENVIKTGFIKLDRLTQHARVASYIRELKEKLARLEKKNSMPNAENVPDFKREERLRSDIASKEALLEHIKDQIALDRNSAKSVQADTIEE